MRRALVAAVVVFLVLAALSMACYPGGNALDPAAPGHDFVRNFICDLLQPRADNGAPNPVGRVALPVGLLALGVGVALFWLLLPGLVAGAALGRGARGAGLVSVAGLVAVALTPAEAAGHWHAVAIFTACLPALVACVAAVWGLARAGRTALAALGALTLIIGTVDGVLYAEHLRSGGAVIVWLPALQRLSMGLFIVWMLAGSRARAAPS